MAWEDGVPGPPCQLCKGHRPQKLQGQGAPGETKARPLFQGRDISSGSQQEGSAHSPVGGRVWGSTAMTPIVSRFRVS